MLHAQDSRRNLSSTLRLPSSDNKGIIYTGVYILSDRKGRFENNECMVVYGGRTISRNRRSRFSNNGYG